MPIILLGRLGSGICSTRAHVRFFKAKRSAKFRVEKKFPESNTSDFPPIFQHRKKWHPPSVEVIPHLRSEALKSQALSQVESVASDT